VNRTCKLKRGEQIMDFFMVTQGFHPHSEGKEKLREAFENR
jgi:hypothetical protein